MNVKKMLLEKRAAHIVTFTGFTRPLASVKCGLSLPQKRKFCLLTYPATYKIRAVRKKNNFL